MYRVDKKLFVVLKEIGMKKENLIVLIKIPFFIECRCDVAEDTNILIRKNHSFPFFYYLTKINFVLLHAINLKIVINYFFTVFPSQNTTFRLTVVSLSLRCITKSFSG